MLLKSKDSRKKDIEKLEQILKKYKLPRWKREKIEAEILKIKAGERGEKDAAYYIDYYCKDSENRVVMHDLRIEYKGQVAQIDHLIINRIFDIYVLESKNFKYGVKINDMGEFAILTKKGEKPIPSPIEQLDRHIFLLEKLIKEKSLMPERVGVRLTPQIFGYVLFSPDSKIIRSKRFNTDRIIKMDMLQKVFEKRGENIGIFEAFKLAPKMSSLNAVKEFALKILMYHKPIKMDWEKRFGINDDIAAEKKKTFTNSKNGNKSYFCANCKVKITEKEAYYCWNKKDIFKGKAYCFKCQKLLKRKISGKS